MDQNFHSLPPLKRFRLLQQNKHQSQPNIQPKPLQLSPSNLPAKKRFKSRHPFIQSNESNENENEKENTPPNPPTPTPTPYCLPAKKRIWAILPESSPIKTPPLCPRFDLNLEYNPSPEPQEKTTQIEIKPKHQQEDDGNEDDDDDDGILCAVCESTDGDPSDPIVFCDGCDLMVHSTCYGTPLIKSIPEGEWFCSRCSNSAKDCCLCPVPGGAMKATSDGRWAHIVCAVLVPEVFFEDPEGRDGIDCSRVPKRRWRGRCYLCKEMNKGCVIECSEEKCQLAFHVTCGLKDDLCIELKHGKKNSGGIVAAFCQKHTLLWNKQKQTGKFKIVARDEENKV